MALSQPCGSGCLGSQLNAREQPAEHGRSPEARDLNGRGIARDRDAHEPSQVRGARVSGARKRDDLVGEALSLDVTDDSSVCSSWVNREAVSGCEGSRVGYLIEVLLRDGEIGRAEDDESAEQCENDVPNCQRRKTAAFVLAESD